jgi:hypothetical protein
MFYYQHFNSEACRKYASDLYREKSSPNAA